MKKLVSRIAALPKGWMLAIVAVTVTLAMGASVAAVGVLSGESTSDSEPIVESSPSAEPASSNQSTRVAGGGGNINNEVVLVNRQDGRKHDRAGFGTARVTGDTAANKNGAAAFSSCVDCRTVAVAVQIVLIMSDASTISPQNLAIAMNQGCQGCTTAAFAYQYVITTDGIVRFTQPGQTQMASLRAQISDVTASDLDPWAMDAKLDGLVDELWNVVDTELVAAGVQATKTPKKAREITIAPDSPEATPFPSTEPSPSPSSTPTPSPSPSPSPTPSPRESPTPSPSPSPT